MPKKKKGLNIHDLELKACWKTLFCDPCKHITKTPSKPVEWSAEDQGLWVAALDIVRLMERVPHPLQDTATWQMVEFATIWRNELLLG